MPGLAARHLYEFANTVLVECPACRGRAVVSRTSPAEIETNRSKDRRFSCLACAHSRLPALPHAGELCWLTSGLRLWLEMDTRHGRIFALN
ncbi:MAG: hypothetical protein JF615_04370, partial [Asticcacaulis sp.]|nr:hypothetical protein [Asticcacaulis sp.]